MKGDYFMKTIAFIGVGNMGFGMAKNLLEAGYTVKGSDVNPAALKRLEEAVVNVYDIKRFYYRVHHGCKRGAGKRRPAG